MAKARPEQLFSSDSSEAFATAGPRRPLALIVEPTRDLAEQVFLAVKDFTKHITSPGLECALAIGGGESAEPASEKIEKKLKNGVDIVVGTLGKLNALVKSKCLDLSQIRFFILDEADRLLSTDSLDSVMDLFNHCPGGGTGQHRLQVRAYITDVNYSISRLLYLM